MKKIRDRGGAEVLVRDNEESVAEAAARANKQYVNAPTTNVNVLGTITEVRIEHDSHERIIRELEARDEVE